ncbi:hypothetical protein Patl1_33145 [Pistacia atlantica]|uniref:Uncharacterized protein n=1 Tax=Pistacia atlantica TaxID=434234 RepID=A0ACC1ARM2_9ROSI|nr:hypothetical protein Patl1_33145 [Pistacia atlantica]
MLRQSLTLSLANVAISPLPLHPPKSHFSTRTKMTTKTTFVTLQLLSWGRRLEPPWAVALKRGRVWGKGDGGRLGFGHENSVFVPSLNPYLGVDPVQCVALGGVHSVALTSLGKIFTWGYGGFGTFGHSVYHRELFPRLVKGSWKQGKYKDTSARWNTYACNNRMLFFLTDPVFLGTLLGVEMKEMEDWALVPGRGLNEGGGLGIPSKVKALPVLWACFLWWLFYNKGERGRATLELGSSNYKLGRGDKVGGWRPKPIPSLEDMKAKFFLGDMVDMVRLGHSSTENQKVSGDRGFSDERVVYIACGGSSSAAIHNSTKMRFEDKGKLYMWGKAKDSQLGVPGLPEVQPCPVEVKFLTEDDGLEPHKVLSVAVGASHAMCLVSR